MKHFKTQEIVSEGVYKRRGERTLQLVDNRIQLFLDELREALGLPITCNDWVWGGQYHWRGLRNKDSEDYSEFSQHSFGRAIDFKVKGMSSEEVRQWLIKNRDLPWMRCVTFIEDAVSWVHVDLRAGTGGDLWLYNIFTKENKVYKRS